MLRVPYLLKDFFISCITTTIRADKNQVHTQSSVVKYSDSLMSTHKSLYTNRRALSMASEETAKGFENYILFWMKATIKQILNKIIAL